MASTKAKSSKLKSSPKPRAKSSKPLGSTVTASPNVGLSGTSREMVEVPQEIADAGYAEKYPSTAPTPVEEAMEMDKKALEEAGDKLTLTQRVERLEQAITSGHNIDLNQFAPSPRS